MTLPPIVFLFPLLYTANRRYPLFRLLFPTRLLLSLLLAVLPLVTMDSSVDVC
jgi:hypothetical protein